MRGYAPVSIATDILHLECVRCRAPRAWDRVKHKAPGAVRVRLQDVPPQVARRTGTSAWIKRAARLGTSAAPP